MIGGDFIGDAMVTNRVNDDYQSSAQIDDPHCIAKSQSEKYKGVRVMYICIYAIRWTGPDNTINHIVWILRSIKHHF